MKDTRQTVKVETSVSETIVVCASSALTCIFDALCKTLAGFLCDGLMGNDAKTASGGSKSCCFDKKVNGNKNNGRRRGEGATLFGNCNTLS